MKKNKKQEEKEKEGKWEKESLVAESPCYEGAIERRNVVVVPGSVAPTERGSGVRCDAMTGGVEPDARRGRKKEKKREKEREGPNERGRGRKRQNDKREGKRAGRTGSREGEDEEGGDALKGKRSQCTAGECNARQAIRGPTSESTFYRTLRRIALLFLFLSRGYTHMRQRCFGLASNPFR